MATTAGEATATGIERYRIAYAFEMTGSDDEDEDEAEDAEEADDADDATAETEATAGTDAVIGLYGTGAAAAAAETVATEEAIATGGRPNGAGAGDDSPKSSVGPSSKYEKADDEAAAVGAANEVTAGTVLAVALETANACASASMLGAAACSIAAVDAIVTGCFDAGGCCSCSCCT